MVWHRHGHMNRQWTDYGFDCGVVVLDLLPGPGPVQLPALPLSLALRKHSHAGHYALICVACFAAWHSASHTQIHWLTLGKQWTNRGQWTQDWTGIGWCHARTLN